MEKNNNYTLMKQGKSYQIDDYLFDMQKKCAKKLKIINQLPFGNKRRDKLFNKLFGDIETNNIIKEGFHCNYGFNIHIGSNNYINFDVTILDSYEIYIGIMFYYS